MQQRPLQGLPQPGCTAGTHDQIRSGPGGGGVKLKIYETKKKPKSTLLADTRRELGNRLMSLPLPDMDDINNR